MVAKRTARAERVQTINQARALVLTGPDDIRARFAGHATGALELALPVSGLSLSCPRSSSQSPSIRFKTFNKRTRKCYFNFLTAHRSIARNMKLCRAG